MLCVTALTACGGGGGGGGGSKSENPTPTPTPSPTPTPTPTSTTSRTITLTWTPPSTRVDGTPLALSEISGYNLYYFREESSSGGTTLGINSGSAQMTQVTLRETGTYHFAISTIDRNGLVGPLSNYASVTAR